MRVVVSFFAIVIISFSSLANAQVGMFTAPANLIVGDSPLSVCAADLDGDQYIDLATANYQTDNIAILFNNGRGGFLPAVFYNSGTGCAGIDAADFDGDSDMDLVVTNNEDYNFSIFLNNGDGTFQAPAYYSTELNGQSIYSNDFDGDNDIDLAIANLGTSDVSIFINNGNGTFQTQVNYAVGTYPKNIYGSDFDGDNDCDLVSANHESHDVSVLINNGDGTFQTAVTYAIPNRPNGIFAIDLDGDTDNDLITANANDNITILFNDGSGTFGNQIDYGVNDFCSSVFGADFDGDSDNDLAVLSQRDHVVSILLNDGAGTFSHLDDFESNLGSGRQIKAADLDNDGDPDLAVANSNYDNVSVLYNRTIHSTDFYYLPGDANMREGNWPPHAWGNDVTYLQSYFRTGDDYPCLLNGLYTAGDATGDCMILGSDISRLFSNILGYPNGEIAYCEDYPPMWLSEDDCPVEAPVGWPDCEPMGKDEDIKLDGNVEIWIGNLDGSPIEATFGERLYVDVYIQTDASVYGGDLHIPLGTNDLYVDSLLSRTEGWLNDDVAHWKYRGFSFPFNSPPNPEGWSCQSLAVITDPFFEPEVRYIHWEEPTKIATFVAKVVNNQALADETVDCFDIGSTASGWPLFCGDSTGLSDSGYNVTIHFSQIHFPGQEEFGMVSGNVLGDQMAAVEGAMVTVDGTELEQPTDEYGHFIIPSLFRGDYNLNIVHPDYSNRIKTINVVAGETTFVDITLGDFKYLPGDANMSNSIWPPTIIGSDVTYLVGYFRTLNQPCLLNGFYSAADVNGDCQVIGSDVTRLVSYFRGLTTLDFCPDFQPAWLIPEDCPETMPSGWPECE